MHEETIFFTGATSGIGKVTATTLASKGAHVVATYRSAEKKQALIDYYSQKFPDGKGKMDFIHCDLNSLESVQQACKEFKERHSNLTMFFANAGIMNFKWKASNDNIEQTFQVNLLAPILMTHLLIDQLSMAKRPKLIYTSSALHQGNIHFDNLEFKDAFSSFKVYRQSKLGIILLTRFLSERFRGTNLGVYAVHPGVVKTELGRDANFFSKLIFKSMGTTPENGAKTLIHVAEKHQDELRSGEYYAKRKVVQTTPESYDLEVAEQLLLKTKDYLFDFLEKDSLLFKY